MSTESKKARTLVGRVVSDRMDKSISVVVERLVEHPLYRKYVRKSSKLMAHDETNECNEGDKVTIEECRPISKSKSWRLQRVIKRAARI